MNATGSAQMRTGRASNKTAATVGVGTGTVQRIGALSTSATPQALRHEAAVMRGSGSGRFFVGLGSALGGESRMAAVRRPLDLKPGGEP